jgi:hypothetical protein
MPLTQFIGHYTGTGTGGEGREGGNMLLIRIFAIRYFVKIVWNFRNKHFAKYCQAYDISNNLAKFPIHAIAER